MTEADAPTGAVRKAGLGADERGQSIKPQRAPGPAFSLRPRVWSAPPLPADATTASVPSLPAGCRPVERRSGGG